MFRSAALKPFEQLARQNLAMFQAATEMMTGGLLREAGGKPAEKAGEKHATTGDDVAQLKEQLAALQARIDGLKG
jgi:polyhydroxyalkanoate synthesis regulator protein